MSTLFVEHVSKYALLPTKGTTHAAGFDIHCDIKGRLIQCFDPDNQPYSVFTDTEDLYIPPMHRVLVPTGWKMRCAEDHCIKFLPRSGLSLKAGIAMVNSVGLIDADYSNETGLILTNLSDVPFRVIHNDRLGQLLVEEVLNTRLVEVDELPSIESNREGGFGSSGTQAL